MLTRSTKGSNALYETWDPTANWKPSATGALIHKEILEFRGEVLQMSVSSDLRWSVVMQKDDKNIWFHYNSGGNSLKVKL